MVTPLNPIRPDAVAVESAPRPTPTPVRIPFGQVLARGAGALVQGAQSAMSAIPGAPVMALSIRGPSGPLGGVNVTPEGPGGAGSGVSLGGLTGVALGGVNVTGIGTGGTLGATDGGTSTGIDSTLQQSQQMNLYYLQVQETMNEQNRSFTTYSDVLKAEHDTAKTAIGNIH